MGKTIDLQTPDLLSFLYNQRDGTGLGLPIAKKIVEAHQGSLEVFDNPTKGVTFRVIIPVR